ncbi:MAG: hypothetical protein DWQ02_27645 [Bacteroidetes bacterium]|nr:MAG: hypothetical protein DWQ02_27645 [Bacteroidota bacterium]
MTKKLLALIFFTSILMESFGQIGGQTTYDFMNLPSSSRISALGGHLITVSDEDVALAYHTPSLLNQQMHGSLSFNQGFHVAGIKFGYFGYGHHVSQWNTTFHGGIQYTSYGTFDLTDDRGDVLGTFKANEFAITLGAGYQWQERLTLGANVKLITSAFESYNSVGLTTDLSATYADTSKRLAVTLLAKNIGTQLSTYREDNSERIPFEMQVGVSKQLKYLPFRLSVVYRYFDKWDILYDDPEAEDEILFLGEEPQERSQASVFADNLFRHFVFSGEFLLGKKENLRLRLGYSHLRQKEMTISNFRGFSGFSFGFGIKVKTFRLDYGRSNFHLGQKVHHIGISTNLGEYGGGRRTSGV